MDSERDRPAAPGTRVGLGRVVENRSGLGHEEPGTDGPATPASDAPGVDEASDASFPASDPPGFMSEPATPADREDPA